MKLSSALSSMLCMLILVLSCSVSSTFAAQRGLAWGTNDNWGNAVAKGLFKWYWHWQDGPNSNFNGKLEWVPCYWGPKYNSQWSQRKSEMNANLPKNLLAFNEPDISGQSNLDANYAATLWMQEIQPWKNRGVRLGSPQIVWDQNWLKTFMSACKSKGCTVDFIAIHWYGSWSDLAGLKNYVNQIYNTYKLPIWVTEYGVTAASGGSQQQVKDFHMQATAWLNSQSFVERSSNFGAFPYSNPPDNYGSRLNALFNGDGSLRDLAYWYIYSQNPSKRSIRFETTAERDSLPESEFVDVTKRGTV